MSRFNALMFWCSGSEKEYYRVVKKIKNETQEHEEASILRSVRPENSSHDRGELCFGEVGPWEKLKMKTVLVKWGPVERY